MGATTSHRRGYGTGYSGRSIQPQNVFWGWSHQNQQLEMMDLPDYLDSMRQTYDAAVSDLSNRLQSLSTMFNQPPSGQAGHRHEHGHAHHDCGCGAHDDCGCGCGGQKSNCGRGHDDCGCQCCVKDADVIVYAHCGELRVVPIEVTNDTRREREDVSVEVSEVRSAGGHKLPWQVIVNPPGPLTLPPCSTTKLELAVLIHCPEPDSNDGGKTDNAKAATRSPAKAAKAAKAAEGAAASARTLVLERLESGDVDHCEVGYVTIRLGGCLVSPIVVAIAVLPDRCDSYQVGCSCSCCC